MPKKKYFGLDPRQKSDDFFGLRLNFADRLHTTKYYDEGADLIKNSLQPLWINVLFMNGILFCFTIAPLLFYECAIIESHIILLVPWDFSCLKL